MTESWDLVVVEELAISVWSTYGLRYDQTGDARYDHIVLGPVPCQGCKQEVVYLHNDEVGRLGWLHESGDFKCPPYLGMTRREWKASWRRRAKER